MMSNENCLYDPLNLTNYTNKLSPSELTRRELEVLRYVILGYTAKKVALRLNISFRTVEKHISNIKMKLGCFTKGDIIQKAITLGVITFTVAWAE